MLAEYFSALVVGLDSWKARKQEDLTARQGRNAAIGAVMDAAITTKAYLKDRDTGRDDNRKVETEIARLWQRAATAIDGYDHQLYTSASLKALGWADPAEWKRAEGREWAIKIDTIIEQCQWLRREHKG